MIPYQLRGFGASRLDKAFLCTSTPPTSISFKPQPFTHFLELWKPTDCEQAVSSRYVGDEVSCCEERQQHHAQGQRPVRGAGVHIEGDDALMISPV